MNVAKGRKLSAEAVGRLAEASLPGVRETARYAVSFLCGLLYARGVVFSRCAPFGAAAVAACPYRYLLSTLLGALAGALLPGQAQTPARYLAAVLAAAAIRWTVNDVARLRSHPAFAPVTALLPLVSTGLAMAFVNGSPTSTVAVYFAESVLGAGAAYFAARSVEAAGRAASGKPLSGTEAASLALAGGLLLLPLADLTLGPVSFGRVLASLLVLLASRSAGAAGGAVAGVAAGVLFGLSTAGLTYLSGAYALGGLMAGLFSPLGRLCSAAVFTLSGAVASLQVGNQQAVLAGLARVRGRRSDLPRTAGAAGRADLRPVPAQGRTPRRATPCRRTVVMKLDYAAKALGGVSETVEEVSRKLSFTGAPDISALYRRQAEDACAGCGLRIYCWSQHYGDTMGRPQRPHAGSARQRPCRARRSAGTFCRPLCPRERADQRH